MGKNGFGMLELLLGLLIMAIISAATYPLLKSNFSENEQSVKNVQQQINDKVNDIETMKKQQADYFNETFSDK